MTTLRKDPLLAIAKGVLLFLMGVMALGGIASAVAIPVLLLNQNHVTIELAKEGIQVATPDFVGAVSLILVLVVALMAVLFWIFRLLKQIVDTVGAGDPFVPENASRLTRMAWLTLGVQLISLPIAAIAMWVGEVTEGARDNEIQIDGGLDGNGLLLMLILFILARVFRKGSQMREELEGTV